MKCLYETTERDSEHPSELRDARCTLALEARQGVAVDVIE